MKKRSRPARGQSLVEFALILVVLLILLGGMIDMGRVLAVYVRLNDAAQEGAAYAAIRPADTAGIRQRALSQTHSSTASVNVAFLNAPCAGQGVEVKVQDAVPLIFPFTRVFLPGGSVAVRATSVNTVLRPACVASP